MAASISKRPTSNTSVERHIKAKQHSAKAFQVRRARSFVGLLSGSSLTAIASVVLLSAPAKAAPAFGSPGWFAAAQAQHSSGLASRTIGVPSSVSGAPAPLDARAQALASRSLADLTKAAQAVTAAQASQLKAQIAARALPSAVPDGLEIGRAHV